MHNSKFAPGGVAAMAQTLTAEQKRKRTELAAVVGIPVLLLLLYLFKRPIVSLVQFVGTCGFYTVTGKYCPGCGNTRSVRCMLNGDFLLALRMNLTMPFLTVLGALFYIEMIFDLLGKRIRIVPRKIWFLTAVLAFFGIYFIVRNFMPGIAPIPMP